ncbi:MAG: UTP--glucose-1-phosphate uridylyltransferase [Ilumatobacteraceae bacterium]
MPVRIAVIPAAGRGTRFLPATKVVPKELLPVFDTPSLQHTVDEAIGAGIEHVILVSNRAKPAIEVFAETATGGARITVVYQDSPRGLGHAVECARELVGKDPFAVLLPDELMGDSSHLRDLIAEHQASGRTAIGLKRVPRDEVSAYGCITPDGNPDSTGRVVVRDVVEKPKMTDAPSDLVIIGRYVFGHDLFDFLASLKPAANGELQLSDAIGDMARLGKVNGVLISCTRHDTGTPMGMLTASIDAALSRADTGPQLRSWLETRLKGS